MDEHDDLENGEAALFARLAAENEIDRSACPSPETLMALAEDALVERDATEALAHVALCGPCRRGLAESRELLRLASEVRALERAAAPAPTPVATVARPEPRRRAWFDWRPGVAGFALAAGACAGLWFGYAAPQLRVAGKLETALQRAKDDLARIEESERLAKAVAERAGRANEVQVARLEAAESALLEMPLPAADWALAGSTGRVRGGESPTVSTPEPVSPVGEAVADRTPLLRYRPLAGASSHRVVLESEADGSAPEVVAAGANAVRPAAPLVRGARYRWSVVAMSPSGLTTSPGAVFRVLAPEDEARIADARKRLRGKPLALAVLLARAGLRAEARNVLRAVRPEDPASKTARRWLATLE